MSAQSIKLSDQIEFLTGLVNSHTDVAGDILQMGPTTWAIHGTIPIDGDVLVAEYDSREAAQAALAQLPPNWVSADHTDRASIGS